MLENSEAEGIYQEIISCVVVSYSEENLEKREDPYFYCTNRTGWEVEKIMRTYARHS